MQRSPEGFGKHAKYRVLTSLGAGGFAEVYLTALRGPVGVNKLVVIKKLKPELALDTAFLLMFVDEARLAARLNHPNVVQTYEVVEEARDCFIAMEYLEGQSLNRVLSEITRKGEWLDPLIVCRIVSDALSGLHYAHELKDLDGTKLDVIHRDVSPHNVFVTYEGQVKVMDFGLAKASDNLTRTEAGIIKGKLSYMPPEQLRGANVDRRADVFAMGVVFWELLAQQRMRMTLDDPTRIASEVAPRVKSARPELDDELDAIVSRALESDRARRYPTAKDMRDAIDAYVVKKGRVIRPEDVGAPVAALFAKQRDDLAATVQSRIQLMLAQTQAGAEGGVLARAVAKSARPPPVSAPPSPPVPTRKPPPLPPRARPPSAAPPPAYAPAPIPVLPLATRGAGGVGKLLVVAVAVAAFTVLGVAAAVVVVLLRARAGRPPVASVPASTTAAAPDAPPVVAVAAPPVSASASRPVPVASDCPDAMVRIGAATFMMGGEDYLYPASRPPHSVRVSAFCIDHVEVTWSAYTACATCAPAASNAWPTIRKVDSDLFDPLCTARDPGAHPAHPMNCVSWNEATAYCAAAGKRLPTEAEWELAARGEDARRYPWGDAAPTSELVNACGDECVRWKSEHRLTLLALGRDDLPYLLGAYSGDDGFPQTAPGGSFPRGASPAGVQDLSGNVAEWVADWFAPYTGRALVDPKGPEGGTVRVVRGGSWAGARGQVVSATARGAELPDTRLATIGFRCAR
jgi:formylglycine-generating enzyme required for sulfatase activity/serine/threonine protein kinase